MSAKEQILQILNNATDYEAEMYLEYINSVKSLPLVEQQIITDYVKTKNTIDLICRFQKEAVNSENSDIRIQARLFEKPVQMVPYTLFNSLFTNARQKMTKFDNVEDALDSYKPGNVLINFAEINKYGIFDTHKEFTDFMEAVFPQLEISGLKYSYYQIMMTSEKQKLAFICSDQSLYQKIELIIHRAFNKKCTTHNIAGNQVDIKIDDMFFENKTESLSFFSQIYEKIRESDKTLAASINTYVDLVNKKANIQYNMVDLGEIKYGFDEASLLKMLSNCPLKIDTININSNNTNSIVGNVNSSITTKQRLKKENDDQIIKWISDNPPKDETKQEYHKRIAAAIPSVTHFNAFCKLMKNLGYETVKKGDKGRIWSK